jgi:altronate dehydratase small subunit
MPVATIQDYGPAVLGKFASNRVSDFWRQDGSLVILRRPKKNQAGSSSTAAMQSMKFSDSDARLLFVDPKDNVCTATRAIESGTPIQLSGCTVLISQTIPFGFKIAACKIALYDKVIKYGVPIGSATRDIAMGEMVHVHNMKSDYLPTYTLDPKDRP